MFHRMSRKMKKVRTGVDEELGISYTLIFLWIAAARKRLLPLPSVPRRLDRVCGQERAHSGEMERRLTCCVDGSVYYVRRLAKRDFPLTPVSPERAIVLEQMPDQASQKRISWS